MNLLLLPVWSVEHEWIWITSEFSWMIGFTHRIVILTHIFNICLIILPELFLHSFEGLTTLNWYKPVFLDLVFVPKVRRKDLGCSIEVELVATNCVGLLNFEILTRLLWFHNLFLYKGILLSTLFIFIYIISTFEIEACLRTFLEYHASGTILVPAECHHTFLFSYLWIVFFI